MHKYEITLYWSNGNRAFVAVVPKQPGCMVRGDSRGAALKNVHAPGSLGSTLRRSSATQCHSLGTSDRCSLDRHPKLQTSPCVGSS